MQYLKCSMIIKKKKVCYRYINQNSKPKTKGEKIQNQQTRNREGLQNEESCAKLTANG